MRKIIYGRPDGGISVVHPVINTHADGIENPARTETIDTPLRERIADPSLPARRPITEAEAEQRAWDRLMKDVPDAINPRWVDESEIPADRTFRDAWEQDLSVDVPKAREITKQRLRRERAPLIAALDVAYMRADELGDGAEKARIANEKRRLRDVTTLADGVTDLAALKELRP